MSYLRKCWTTSRGRQCSYRPATSSSQGYTAMGDLSSIVNAVGIATDLASDPYLPETVCRIGQARDIDRGQTPGACAKTKAGLPGGVGLRKLIVPLRGYVYAEQHPWVYALAAAGIIGLPMLLGYTWGKGSK